MRRAFVSAAATLLVTATNHGVEALYSKSSPVKLLAGKDFTDQVMKGDGLAMVEFFASWCGHCKQLAPEYEKAAKALKGVVSFVAVEDQATMQSYGVKGFPTIKWFGENKNSPEDYQGQRTAKAMVDFAMQKVTALAGKRLGQKVDAGSSGSGGGSSGGSGGSANTVVLTDANFQEKVMKDEKGVWFVKFYAPWCGHCKAIAGVWDDLASNLKGKVNVAKMDATVEKSTPGRFGVQGFPTIKLFPAGKKTDSSAVDYNEGRDLGSFERFAMQYYSMTREAEQLLTQKQLDESCTGGSNNICVIAFLPHIMDSNAEGRKKYIKDYNAAIKASSGVPCSFFWSQGGDQYELEEKLNLGFGFPALVGISMKKNIFVVHRGSFTESSIRTFLTGLSAPKHLNDLPKALPSVVKQKAWDGKDAPKDEDL